MKRSLLTLTLALIAGPAPAIAQSLLLGRAAEPARCDVVDVSADAMTCGEDLCELRGHVHVACEQLALWADEADLSLGPDGGFAGAVARGNVLMVEGNTVLECRRLTLAEDRVQGRIDRATFHIKRAPVRRDDRGLPTGRDEAVFTGDVERHDRKRLHVADATFTLCDCGDDPPSWVLDAREIDATLGERATLWWPQLRFNVPGVGELPGPPLLPISLALGGRVMGLLPPEISFLGAWPTVDLPVFIPIGDSWDVTFAPGMRFDWGTAVSPISRWGAPRLGGRLRYAPSTGTRGEVRVSWTGDFKGVGARRFAGEKALPVNPSRLDAYIDANGINDNVAQLLARQALTHRVSVEVDHRTDFSDELSWLLAAEWLSDDLIPADFRVSLEDRVANYVPSRTQLLWRTPGVSAVAAADYLLALSNSRIGNLSEFDYSNLNGREAGVAHRGPQVQLSLLPWRLARGIHLEADLSFVRYGAWTEARAPDRVVAGGRVGLGYLDRLGPINLSAEAHLDTLWLDPTRAGADVHAAAILDAEANLRVAATSGKNVAHVIEPRLTYRGLPWLSNDPSAVPPVDPRFDRAELHQLALVLDQSWWRLGKAARRIGGLSVSQPIDLETGDVLHTRARLDIGGRSVRLGAWADLDLSAGNVEEFGAEASARWRWLSVRGNLARWSPRADRLRRTLYELGATGPALSDGAWVHTVRGSASVRFGALRGSYSADYLLPIEEVDCATPDEAETCGGQRVPGFTRHAFSVTYTSPCDCWGVGVSVDVPAADPSLFRARLMFEIGGYRVGN